MKTSVTLLICVCVHHVATSPLPQFDYPETSFSVIPTSLSDMGLSTGFQRHTGFSSGLNNRFSSGLDDGFYGGLGNTQQIGQTQSYSRQCVHRSGTGLAPTTLCRVNGGEWQSVGGSGSFPGSNGGFTGGNGGFTGGFPGGNGGFTGSNGGGNGGGTRDYPDPRGEEEGGGSEDTNEGVPTGDDAEIVRELKARRRGQRVIGSQYHF
ncbi:uncharacterized protein LOC128987724 [Macrosteles quadrilineatus]|uniref:uncharacterized protein LOC128987724 n=1 Tax=Macrosteles quadrilineatus TaxID=74068 RepID=UPI0023E2A22B|nr:uncharacterized protein LOC128987724 [Macrosteles quadrilineatus]